MDGFYMKKGVLLCFRGEREREREMLASAD